MLVSGVRSSWETVETKLSLARSSSSSRCIDRRCCSNARACISEDTRSWERPAQIASSRCSHRRGATDCTSTQPRTSLPTAIGTAASDRTPRASTISRPPSIPSRGSSSARSTWSGSRCCAASNSCVVSTSGRSTNDRGRGRRATAGVALHVPRTPAWCSPSTGSTSHRSTPSARPTDSAARLTSCPDARSWVSAECTSSTTSGCSGWSSSSAWTDRISSTES